MGVLVSFAQIKKISKETNLKIQFYIEKHVSQLF